MFQRILIANRGEIAVRIIRACKELGIETVAIYSTADKDALHVMYADMAVCVGGPKSSDSYLNQANIIQAAVSTGSEAIHPGFGFLSENAEFVKLCEQVGIRFIGPSSDAISNMGNKSKAREIMQKAGVSVVPGSDGKINTLEEAYKIAEEINYPVLIKASAGGGGRGMRIAYNSDDLADAYKTAKMEAKNAFGDDSLYMERYVLNPKHIEFQILADKFGNVIHLGERDCSVQRRNQKVIEEAPSSTINNELRKKMGEQAILAAKSVNYTNAGTIEFLVTGNEFFFIEMNTRIQVEHPVTELITGIDIVKEQIRIASGGKLDLKQEDIKFEGHAIECRINAEDPKQNFRPSPGKINYLNFAGGPGVRVDSGVYQGYEVSPHYDSMVCKLIVHDKNRVDAIKKMRRALEEMVFSGIETNMNFLYLILHNPMFVRGRFDTAFIEKNLDLLVSYETDE